MTKEEVEEAPLNQLRDKTPWYSYLMWFSIYLFEVFFCFQFYRLVVIVMNMSSDYGIAPENQRKMIQNSTNTGSVVTLILSIGGFSFSLTLSSVLGCVYWLLDFLVFSPENQLLSVNFVSPSHATFSLSFLFYCAAYLTWGRFKK